MKQAVWLAAALMMLLPLGKVYSKERSERENNTLRIMSYNIRNGRGMDDMTDFRRTAEVINKVCPDVVAVQELDSVTGRSGGKDVLREIAGLTLMHHIYAPAIDYDGGKYGIGMLSKEKPLGYRYLSLPGREEARALLVVEFEKYIYCCTHLSLTEEDRMLSLPVIQQVAASANKPFFIAGDMNAHPDSEFIRQLKNDFVILTDMEKPTFPADKPDETLDYNCSLCERYGCLYPYLLPCMGGTGRFRPSSDPYGYHLQPWERDDSSCVECERGNIKRIEFIIDE